MKNYDLIKDEKVWSSTKSNITFMHAFLSGADKPAACRKNIKAGSDTLLAQTARARTMLPTNYCETCVDAVIAMVDRREASMQSSTGEGDYLPPAQDPTPVCICPRMEPPAKFGHHVVCPLRATDTDTEETFDMKPKRRTDGPLSVRQEQIIDHLIGGERQNGIAKTLIVAESYVSAELQLATSKLKARTAAQACSFVATARAYREAAGMLIGAKVHEPIDPAEEHVNHVLGDLAKILVERADRLMPQ